MNSVKIDKKNDGIAAAMKKQSAVAVCTDAIDEWKKRTVYKACEVSVIKGQTDSNTTVWIDKPLFTEAIADLLEFAAQASENSNSLKLTVTSGGQTSCLIMIDYASSLKERAKTHSPDGRFNSVTRQIISQHGGSLDFSDVRAGSRITIRIP